VYCDQLRVATISNPNTPSTVQHSILPTIKHSQSVPWLLRGNVASQTSHNRTTCEWEKKKDHPTVDFLRDSLMNTFRLNLTKDCNDLVVISATFDSWTLEQFQFSMVNRQNYSQQKMLESHGRCFFLFTSSEVASQVKHFGKLSPLSLIDHYWVIPLPFELLSFALSRQNNLFIKYVGHVLFEGMARTLI
jgi:hypothetical protein